MVTRADDQFQVVLLQEYTALNQTLKRIGRANCEPFHRSAEFVWVVECSGQPLGLTFIDVAAHLPAVVRLLWGRPALPFGL